MCDERDAGQLLDAAPPTLRGDGGVRTRRDAAIPDDDAAVPGQPARDAGAAERVDITGTWFLRVNSQADVTAPVVGTLPSPIVLAMRIYVKRQGGNLLGEVEVCELETDSQSVTIDFSGLQMYIKQTVSMADVTPVRGEQLPLPDIELQVGQDASGNAVDVDGDGNPGGTVTVTALGLTTFDAWVRMGLKVSISAALEDTETMRGSVRYRASGRVIGTTSPLVTGGLIAVKQTQIPTAFYGQRQRGNVPCTVLLGEAAAAD
jgi:hypothetical protein